MHTETFQVRTQRRSEMQNIDAQVQYILRESGISNGLVTVYVPHTTAGVTINENADPDVVHDVLEALERAVPWQQDFYRHGEGNSAAHVKSSMVSCSLCIPVIDGKMPLGTWQSIFFCEFDGPRTRKVTVAVSQG
jgi:secondary thiamine-phosphate synthase enzyme